MSDTDEDYRSKIMDIRRYPGGQPGNQNARKNEEELAKRTTIRLRPVDNGRIEQCAKELKISRNEVIRKAIKELYEKAFPRL